ncbi:parallel beta-helix repeat (two copies) [Candidatus Methanoperedens nitroreducens]|uniref:Parallel beta-helix repeat (Two copies) n=1 Tax=Candidatus Methanoperedens nitratireducens TaxID=1392998 RepID=A0A062V4V9_9EURY|nr:NosD domain-containing protein [Candidatus Methanoperedens nitroreducens]KCZ70415.1 parallel beta-helix repeat (two copies) [Candidatus Methanoperedens nitroreducens]MDJ1420853.1 NosD domain-containing protein [Candidatus Methanoperedens sp.]
MVLKKIMIGIFVILLTTGFAGAQTLYVGTGQTYTTIQSAIDDASTGDVISVDEGTYSENLIIKKNGISIIGKDKEKTIIDGKKVGSGINIDQANNIKISGFTIQNSNGSVRSDAGISMYSAKNNTIANTIIVNNAVGISIYLDSNNNVISGNDIRSNTNHGILIYSSSDNRIYNNNIQNNKIGIYADSARSNHIYSNNLIDNSNEQAYDNSGSNFWDDGKSGNFWNTHKNSDAYTISGAPKAKDNFPLSSAVTIRYVNVPVTLGQNEVKDESIKSSPGFTGLAILGLLIVIGILKKRQ